MVSPSMTLATKWLDVSWPNEIFFENRDPKSQAYAGERQTKKAMSQKPMRLMLTSLGNTKNMRRARNAILTGACQLLAVSYSTRPFSSL